MAEMRSEHFKNQKGFTLVELMVVLALLGIVLGLGYMFLNFGVMSFNRGERHAIAQQAARITSVYITNELRFAREIEINPVEETMESGYRYFYLSENNSIIFHDESGNEIILADSAADDMDYSIYFTSNIPDDVVIFDIEADGGFYSLNSRVQALNIELYRTYSMEGQMIKLNGEGGSVLKYKIPTRN
jgi:prepilin-type N-terminal cleavage/methylation domain-containing protein